MWKFGWKYNAYTKEKNTVYYFNCISTEFLKMMKLFLCHFDKPVFDEKKITKEIEAINNEH